MKHGWMSATAVALIVGCTVSQSVKTAARLGVQDGSAYIRMKLMHSAARRLIFGVSKPRTFWIAGTHNVEDIRRRAEFLPKLGQLAVDVLIFGSPLLAVLRRNDVMLGVVPISGLVCCAMVPHQSAEPVFAN
jgi:hypothetical protein